MKILHIAPITLTGNNTDPTDKENFFKIGGLSKSVTKLAEAQKFNGHSVGVISTRESLKPFSETIYWDTLENKSFLSLLLNDPFENIEKRFGLPDILNTHDIYEIKQLPFIFHAIRRKIKVFITPRGCLSKVARSEKLVKKSVYINLIFNPLVYFIEGFVALNLGEKKEIRNLYKRKKIVIIHNGIENNEKFLELNKNIFRKKLTKKNINIGFVGRFEVYIKGLDILLEAYSEYQRKVKNTNIELTFIGEHSNKKYNSIKYFKKVRQKLSNNSKFRVLKPLFNEEKWAAMSDFDIFIHNSRTEGMPNAVLEAMSIGIPCVVSPETNMEKIILDAESGWVVENNKHNLIKLFYLIEKLSKDELFEKGQKGLRYSQNKLSWETIAEGSYE